MLLQTYNTNWEKEFNQIAAVIKTALPGMNIQIEHIGSTSIQGLAAKPIIDMDIVYEDPKLFTPIKKGLEQIGYYHNGDQGIEGREVFKRKGMEPKHGVLDRIRHHLYVCHADSEELNRHLAFRDFLRNNEKLKRAYEQLKYQIALKANQDRKEYARLKEEMARGFIESILKRAK